LRPATAATARALLVFVVAGALLLALASCGEDTGVAEGATVTAYVVQPLCAEAERELARHRGRAGELRVRAICLPSPRSPKTSPKDAEKLDLARIGANARRATEDSTTVAVLEPLDKQASRFSTPILETAEIGSLATSSGSIGMQRLLRAIEDSDSGSLRKSVRDALE
jgi:hypothetical protein